MPRCKACGSPIRYADRRRRFPLDAGTTTGHVCLSRRVNRIRWPKGADVAMSFITEQGPKTYYMKASGGLGEVIEVRAGLIEEPPRVREQRKEEAE